MVTAVNTPKEYWIVQNTSSIAVKVIQESLREFTTTKLIEEKLAAKTYKTGLDFLDSKSYRVSLKKLMRAVLGRVEKEIPFLKTANMIEPFVQVDSGTAKYVFNLISDESTFRYLRMVNRAFAQAQIPLRFSDPYGLSFMKFKVDLRYSGTGEDYKKLYMTLFHIDFAIFLMKTLQRKALYDDPTARHHYKSRRYA